MFDLKELKLDESQLKKILKSTSEKEKLILRNKNFIS